jgi:hypothetical protein
MAKLVNCGACEKEISKEASSCPHCGHPNKNVSKPKRKTSLMTKLILVFVVLFAIGKAINGDKKPPQTIADFTTTTLPKPKTADEIKREKILNTQEAKFGKKPEASGWDGSYSEVKRYLEAAANDPDSIKIENCTRVSIDEKAGWVIGCDYRGKNKFGAVVRNSNWFVVKNKVVVKMLPPGAYKQ